MTRRELALSAALVVLLAGGVTAAGSVRSVAYNVTASLRLPALIRPLGVGGIPAPTFGTAEPPIVLLAAGGRPGRLVRC